MPRKRLLILIGSLLVIGTVTTILLWPSSGDQKKSKKEPFEKISAEFLNVDPAAADSIVAEMDLDQKLNALLLVQVTENSDTSNIGTTVRGGAAGMLFEDARYDLMAYLDTAHESYGLPLIRGVHVNGFLGDADSAGTDALFCANKELVNQSFELVNDIRSRYGVNLVSLRMPEVHFDSTNYSNDARFRRQQHERWLGDEVDSLLNDSVLVVLGLPSLPADSIKRDSLLAADKSLVDRGLPVIDPANHASESVQSLDFKGLVIHRVDSTGPIKHFISTDLFITAEPKVTKEMLATALDVGKIHIDQVDAKVKRVVMARMWMKGSSEEWHQPQTTNYFRVKTREIAERIARSSISLVNNKGTVPITGLPDKTYILRIGKSVSPLVQGISNYVDVRTGSIANLSGVERFNWASLEQYSPVIIAINGLDVDSTLLKKLQATPSRTVIVNIENEQNLRVLKDLNSVIHVQRNSNKILNRTGQAIFGGIAINGLQTRSDFGTKTHSHKTRLAHTSPYEVGCDANILRNIDWVADEGIRNRAFPGCQVLAVKQGEVIYSKWFGHQTYRREYPITRDHLFDLASVTKVAATTLVGMRLYDREMYSLQDSLIDYLPDTIYQHLYRRRSTLQNITWSQLYTHTSGLPPGFPYINYVQYIDSITGRYDRYYCDYVDDSAFCIPVAEQYYMEKCYQDSIWIRMNQLWLNDKSYKYSDVNFLVLYKLFRGMIETNKSLMDIDDDDMEDPFFNAYEEYLQEEFYRKLGMERTVFLPRRYFPLSEIAPTEDDKHWRKQLVHGYVHDPTAAILGGISGNAGLFATAENMAILFQMWMQRGSYAGQEYVSPETVDLFIRQQPGSHRGLGFNKPVGGGMYGIAEQASLTTFGHTGFTGNSIWADPENEIIYIFLSNRSHPEPHNPRIINLGTRKRIQRYIYDSCVNRDWLKYIEPELEEVES